MKPTPTAGDESAQVQYFREADSPYPFSAAVRTGRTLYLSGQIGIDAHGKLPVEFDAQVRQAMDNLAASLKLAGLGMQDVVKCTVMIQDMSRWAEFNRIYLTYFSPERLPTRSALGCNGLAFGAAVEIECIAYYQN